MWNLRRESGPVLWVLGPVVYLILELIAAAAFPDYSFTRNYISDLGVTGPRTKLMHVAFCWQGVLFLLGALFIVGVPRSGRHRVFIGLAVANAVGNCLVGTVHRGQLHGLGAVLAIVGGNAAILAGSAAVSQRRWYRLTSKVIAGLGLLSFGVFAITTDAKGAWERGSVYSILLWQLITACCLLFAHPWSDESRTAR